MVLRDSFVYVAEANRFQIVNVARPREPALVGSCVSQDGTYFGLAVQDTLAYVIAGKVQVIDVADPATPTVIGTTSVAGMGIAVRDTFVYVPYGYDTLRVYSSADPTSLRLLGYAPLQSGSSDVALAESIAAVSTVNGLEAFSLEDPAHPHWRAAASTPFYAFCVVYKAPYFYAGLMDGGVAIYSAESLGLEEQVTTRQPPVGLKVRPSLVRDRCLVSLGGMTAGDVSLRDVSGRAVPVAVTREVTDEGLLLDLSKLAAGVYFVEVKADRRISSVKVLKQ